MKLCPICGYYTNLQYELDGQEMCEKCYCKKKIELNSLRPEYNKNNTFKFVDNGKEYIGKITGYKHKKGYEDEFFLVLNISDENRLIFVADWYTENEIAKTNAIKSWNINISELIYN